MLLDRSPAPYLTQASASRAGEREGEPEHVQGNYGNADQCVPAYSGSGKRDRRLREEYQYPTEFFVMPDDRSSRERSENTAYYGQ